MLISGDEPPDGYDPSGFVAYRCRPRVRGEHVGPFMDPTQNQGRHQVNGAVLGFGEAFDLPVHIADNVYGEASGLDLGLSDSHPGDLPGWREGDHLSLVSDEGDSVGREINNVYHASHSVPKCTFPNVSLRARPMTPACVGLGG